MTLRLSTTAFFSRKGMLHRSRFSAATAVSSRRVFSAHGAGAGGDNAELEEKKAKINSAWNNSAEGYVGNIMDKGKVETGFSDPMVTINMSVGHKLVTRIVADVSNKAYLKESGSPVVLDIASAGGEPAITIAKAIPTASVHATDFAPAMTDHIRRRVGQAGVSNVTAGVADGEALTEFSDASVDAVTCTWGLIFMPQWQKAVQEFSRVLKKNGVVAVTLWEKSEDSILARFNDVLETLVPGYEGVVDPETLGEDGGSAVAEEMKTAGLRDVSVTEFSVPVTLSPRGRPGDIWEFFTLSSPMGQTMSTLEEKGRKNVRQEAMEIFESRMAEDWEKGLEPLGLQPFGDGVGRDAGSSSSLEVSQSPRVIYVRALLVTGRKIC
ncbi:unnamed protein product [Pylaiella littoralis]